MGNSWIAYHSTFFVVKLRCLQAGNCNPCFDSQGNLQSPPCEVKRSNYLSQESWLGGDTTCVAENSGWMPIWPLFLYLFCLKRFWKKPWLSQWDFTILAPPLEETHQFHFPKGLLLPVAKQLGNCPTSASSMKPANGILQLSSCGSWKSPWIPQKKMAPSYHGKQGLVLCICRVSSIQEAKLVCIGFFFRNAGV